MGILPRFLLGLAAGAVAVAQQPPFLFLRLVTPAGTQDLAPNHVVQVKNNERIRLQVCIRARSVADRFEQPEIQALNQAPDYFRNRPGPNIKLSIKRIVGNDRREVAFRVDSSGLGKDLAVYYVDADVDILEDRTVRQRKAEQFVEWMVSQPGGAAQSRLLQSGKGSLASYFESQYIHNPPGEYEIAATYTPTTAENWRGVLISTPCRIQAIDGGDFFDLLKEKLTEQR
jgi:hypothetical protein